MSAVSGHVFRYEGNRRPVWRAKYRLPDGRQVQKAIGPAWTARGRPPAGYFTKRSAEAWLRRVLAGAPQDNALVGKAFEPSSSPPVPDFDDSGQGRRR